MSSSSNDTPEPSDNVYFNSAAMPTANDAVDSPRAILTALEDYFREQADLKAAISLLGWDQETYMPEESAAGRASQLKTLSGLAHRHFTSPVMEDLLARAEEKVDKMEPLQARAVEELRRDFDREVQVPEELVREIAMEESRSLEAWKIARSRNEFPIFAPQLRKLLDLKLKIAEIWGYEESPFDALHDQFERGSTAAKLRPIFQRVRERLVPLLEKIAAADYKPPREIAHRAFDVDKQWDFSIQVLKDMGFDFKKGRQDKSIHPFTTMIGQDDTRLTTRFDEREFGGGIGSSIHEGGHGLYDQGLSEYAVGPILAESTSLGIHESQSRLWEKLIGMSEGFWSLYHDDLVRLFPDPMKGVSPRDIYEAMNVVEPSLIRVEADEVTYNLHILVRFELELALLEGELNVNELPGAWNDKYEEYLGIRPKNDAEGCLQDIHWSMGAFGYFPTYTLGNLYSAPFLSTAANDIPALGQSLRGRGLSGGGIPAGGLTRDVMKSLKGWLNDNIHHIGRSETAEEISIRLTDAPLNPDPYLDYLEAKYADIYRLG